MGINSGLHVLWKLSNSASFSQKTAQTTPHFNKTWRHLYHLLPTDRQTALSADSHRWKSDQSAASSSPRSPWNTHAARHTLAHTTSPICYSQRLLCQHQKQLNTAPFVTLAAPLQQKYLSRFAKGWNRRIQGLIILSRLLQHIYYTQAILVYRLWF